MSARFLKSPLWGVVVAILCVTWAFLAGRVERSLDITVATLSMNRAQILSISEHIRDLRTKSAFFNFRAEITGPAELRLKIQSVHNPEFFDQGRIEISGDGKILKPVQLGSDRWPLIADEDYTFDLVDLYTNQTLLGGKILARVTERPASAQAWAAPLGLASAILALLQPFAALVSVIAGTHIDAKTEQPA